MNEDADLAWEYHLEREEERRLDYEAGELRREISEDQQFRERGK